MRNSALALLAFLLLTTGGTALADARLVTAKPADGATASNVRALSLSFSEAVVDKQSGVDLVMTSMPGMAAHQPMKVSGFQTVLAADGRTLTITLPRALPVGSYSIGWHAVAANGGAKSEGNTIFSVR
jgi:methionine-rich copper-binding protein CopC